MLMRKNYFLSENQHKKSLYLKENTLMSDLDTVYVFYAGVSPAVCLPLHLRVWGWCRCCPSQPRVQDEGYVAHVFPFHDSEALRPSVGPTRCHQTIPGQQNDPTAKIWWLPPALPVPAGLWWILTPCVCWSLVWVLKYVGRGRSCYILISHRAF